MTEADTIQEALEHVRDAVQAVVELYEDLKKRCLRSPVGNPRMKRAGLVSFPLSIQVLVSSIHQL